MVRSRPFGERAIDAWITWRNVPGIDGAAALYRKQWHLVSRGLFGYEVRKISERELRKHVSWEVKEFADLPAGFQADIHEWRGLLRKAIIGI